MSDHELPVGFYSARVQRIPIWADNEWARCQTNGITHLEDIHVATHLIDWNIAVVRAGRTGDPTEHARAQALALEKLRLIALGRLKDHFAMLDIGDTE